MIIYLFQNSLDWWIWIQSLAVMRTAKTSLCLVLLVVVQSHGFFWNPYRQDYKNQFQMEINHRLKGKVVHVHRKTILKFSIILDYFRVPEPTSFLEGQNDPLATFSEWNGQRSKSSKRFEDGPNTRKRYKENFKQYDEYQLQTTIVSLCSWIKEETKLAQSLKLCF